MMRNNSTVLPTAPNAPLGRPDGIDHAACKGVTHFCRPVIVRDWGPFVHGVRHHIGGLITAVTVFLLCCNLPVLLAAEVEAKPLWEIGLVGGGGWVPDYPAADENHAVGIVLPYAVYRGKIFRAGDKGIARGRFVHSDRFEFDISLSGSFPTDSNNNDARRGMPDLDFLLEIGPRLQVALARLGERTKLSFELPVRTVFSVALDGVGYRGVLVHPRLVFRHNDIFATGIQLRVNGGPIFATTELMDYFYEVAPRFATPDRPAFDADSGYLGSEFTMLGRKKLSNRLSIFGAVRLGYYQGATNADSPLFRNDLNISLGLGFSWSLYQSTRRVVE